MKTLIVDKKYENKKLSKYILDTFPHLNKNTFYKTLRKKDIRVNNIKVKDDILLEENDMVSIYLSDDILYPKALLSIVYEDDNILVIDKPSEIEVVGENSLTTEVKNYYPLAMPCHRLDRNTLGLVLFAKNDEALSILLDKFKNKEIEKHYLAKVVNYPSDDHKILTAYLFKDSKKSKVYISDTFKTGYQKIITEYTVLKKNPKEHFSILDITLHTGRTHQIRAHLAHIGHPIIGDRKIWK